MHGVTLIELVVFIVIVAIVVIAMMQSFSGTSRGTYTGKVLTEAEKLSLAKEYEGEFVSQCTKE